MAPPRDMMQHLRGRAGTRRLSVQEGGSVWSRAVQVDVVAINWAEQAILLGECKWGTGHVDRAVIRETLESKTPKVLKDLPEGGAGWKVHHAFFARTGFTDAAQAEARSAGALLVDVATLDADLRRTLVTL